MKQNIDKEFVVFSKQVLKPIPYKNLNLKLKNTSVSAKSDRSTTQRSFTLREEINDTNAYNSPRKQSLSELKSMSNIQLEHSVSSDHILNKFMY